MLATVGYFKAPVDYSESLGFEFPPKFSLVYFYVLIIVTTNLLQVIKIESN